VDLATHRATLEGMKGKKVHSALKGQLMQDIVGSVLTEIKLKRGSTSSFNKVCVKILLPFTYCDGCMQVETQEKSLFFDARRSFFVFAAPHKAAVCRQIRSEGDHFRCVYKLLSAIFSFLAQEF